MIFKDRKIKTALGERQVLHWAEMKTRLEAVEKSSRKATGKKI